MNKHDVLGCGRPQVGLGSGSGGVGRAGGWVGSVGAFWLAVGVKSDVFMTNGSCGNRLP